MVRFIWWNKEFWYVLIITVFAPARAVGEQLCELTRLVLRLPEVDSILQRAGLPSTAARGEPTSALEMFVKLLSERSAMVTRALDYIGDILKYMRPYVVNKNQEGMQLAYRAVVKHWSPLLATSKAQQLLFRIVNSLLLPPKLPQQDKALRDSLPLYLQGLSVASSISQSQGACLKQQLRSVTHRYLEHFLPPSPSLGIIANHPVLLGACETTPTVRGVALRRTILEVLWSFVEENVGVYDRQVYGVLETVAVLDSTVVQALIPNMTLSLRNAEHKRGLGKNIALRGTYMKLLSLLGPSGQAEITSLEGD
ncbi:hypothetical protein GOODEAATRI_007285 [Goodea atripinnis]|uniref:MMS22-like C-terminal domain-containing protein n=1 Tax=Goodea atripinnis TaxID=208336 RepID=A0ABV0MFS2_9TELE